MELNISEKINCKINFDQQQVIIEHSKRLTTEDVKLIIDKVVTKCKIAPLDFADLALKCVKL